MGGDCDCKSRKIVKIFVCSSVKCHFQTQDMEEIEFHKKRKHAQEEQRMTTTSVGCQTRRQTEDPLVSNEASLLEDVKEEWQEHCFESHDGEEEEGNSGLSQGEINEKQFVITSLTAKGRKHEIKYWDSMKLKVGHEHSRLFQGNESEDQDYDKEMNANEMSNDAAFDFNIENAIARDQQNKDDVIDIGEMINNSNFSSAMNVESGDIEYVCKFWGCRFKSKNLTHMKKHVEKSHFLPLPLKIDLVTEDPLSLVSPLTSRNEDTSRFLEFRCHICPFQSADMEVLKMHKIKEHNMNQMKHLCNICGYGSDGKRAFHRHVSTSHGYFPCDQCKFVSNNSMEFYRHKKTVHRDPCNKCRVPLSFKESQESHNSICPMQLGPGPPMDDLKANGLCLTCGVKFPKLSILRFHMNLMHRTFVCQLCKSGVCGKVKFLDHLKNVHDLKCSKCGESFNDTNSMSVHVHVSRGSTLKRLESSSRPKCSICNAVFSSSANLRIHISHIHDRVKRSSCSHCERSFHTESALRSHIKNVHEGVKRYKCTFCDFSSAYSHAFDKHVKRKHTGFTCPRNGCDHREATYLEMQNHVFLAHT